MDGNILKVGVVVGVSYVCYFVFVVRLVMECSLYVFMVGEGVENFVFL